MEGNGHAGAHFALLFSLHRYMLHHVGVDEAGRGPLFGPVVAGAVVLPPDIEIPAIIRDSKTLSPKQIKEAYSWVRKNALAYGVGFVYAAEIDAKGIKPSYIRAMHIALGEVESKIRRRGEEPKLDIWVDGNYFESYNSFPHHTLVKGDSLDKSISAASIVAKHQRDCWIADMCSIHPFLQRLYNLDNNKGYGADFISLTHKHGLTAWHRRTFGDLATIRMRPPEE